MISSKNPSIDHFTDFWFESLDRYDESAEFDVKYHRIDGYHVARWQVIIESNTCVISSLVPGAPGQRR